VSDADDLVTATIAADGRAVELVLRLASFAEVAWLLEGPAPAGEEQVWMMQRLTREVALFDGQPMTVDRAAQLARQPLGDFLKARTRLYREARGRGVLFATCPQCRKGEAEVSAAFLELRLGARLPPLTTSDGRWLPPPALGGAVVRPRRSGKLPLAAGLRFEPPSLRLGLGGRAGVLRALDDDAAWAEHWPEGSFMPDDRPWWYPENAAFRALVRLAAVLGSSLRSVEALPAIDVAYLDFAVTAVEFTPEPVDEAPVPGLVTRKRDPAVVCPACAARFLPLL
jgi:hypothetical protein